MSELGARIRNAILTGAKRSRRRREVSPAPRAAANLIRMEMIGLWVMVTIALVVDVGGDVGSIG